MDTSTIGGELIQVADIVAREKSIEREEVLTAMEEAIQKAGRSRYGIDRDIRASIDRNSGMITLERFTEIVENAEDLEDEATQIIFSAAQEINPDLKIGEFIREPLPPVEFGRIAAQAAKQVISQRVRDAERARQYEEYKDRVGEVVVGTIKRAENYSATIDLGRAEAVIRREDMIPRELLRQGDRIRAYIKDVRVELRGPQIFLSRADNRFMAELFTQEVPEIYDGIIEIKGVVREPGSRAKIAVYSHDPGIHPVGSCVGMRGSRVQAVVNELQGEKIEIIPWSEDVVTFAINSLAPAEVFKVVMHQDTGRLEVIVPDDQLSLAIGRRGQNVRLASQLIGWYIDILSQSDENIRFQERSERFMQHLDIDDVMASLLVAEGFVSIEDIAECEVEELLSIQGFDENIVGELQTRAIDFIERETAQIKQEMAEFAIADDLKDLESLTPAMVLQLAKNKILTLDDLADLDSEELVEFLTEQGLTSQERAGEIIMAARKHWFDDEDTPDEAAGDDGDTAGDDDDTAPQTGTLAEGETQAE